MHMFVYIVDTFLENTFDHRFFFSCVVDTGTVQIRLYNAGHILRL